MSNETLEFLPIIIGMILFSLMAIYRGREILGTGSHPFTKKDIREEDRKAIGYSLIASGIIMVIATTGYFMPDPIGPISFCLMPVSLAMFFIPVYVGTYLRGEN